VDFEKGSVSTKLLLRVKKLHTTCADDLFPCITQCFPSGWRVPSKDFPYPFSVSVDSIIPCIR